MLLQELGDPLHDTSFLMHTGDMPPFTPFTPQSEPASPHGQNSPGSTSDGTGYTTITATKAKIPRHKRESHINAEHRRRNKIQVYFTACLILNLHGDNMLPCL